MLRMNKDHWSAGLRWSLPLIGGSFLSLPSSCFVFCIISFHSWCCGRRFVGRSTATDGPREGLVFFVVIMCLEDPWFSLGKCHLIALSSASKMGGKREHHMGCFYFSLLDFSGGFSLSFLNCSSKFHIMAAGVGIGLSGLAWVLGSINGLRLLPLIFCCHRSLGLTYFGPSKQSLMLWAWVLAKSGHLQLLRSALHLLNLKRFWELFIVVRVFSTCF